MIIQESYAFILALCAAAASGLIGSFALMKRMSLAGDAVSHLALPGLGVAVAYQIHPLLGAASTLALGTVLIWALSRKSTVTAEVAIGIIFSCAIAVGAILLREEDHELLEALFGGLAPITGAEFSAAMVGIAAIFAFVLFAKDRLIVSIFSSDLAASSGINVARLNLAYLFAFSLTVLLGLQSLGTLLMGSLIIIPAAIGRQLTHTFRAFLLASSLAAVLSVAIGFVIATLYGLPLGPTIVSVAGAGFVLSMAKKKR